MDECCRCLITRMSALKVVVAFELAPSSLMFADKGPRREFVTCHRSLYLSEVSQRAVARFRPHSALDGPTWYTFARDDAGDGLPHSLKQDVPVGVLCDLQHSFSDVLEGSVGILRLRVHFGFGLLHPPPSPTAISPPVPERNHLHARKESSYMLTGIMATPGRLHINYADLLPNITRLPGKIDTAATTATASTPTATTVTTATTALPPPLTSPLTLTPPLKPQLWLLPHTQSE